MRAACEFVVVSFREERHGGAARVQVAAIRSSTKSMISRRTSSATCKIESVLEAAIFLLAFADFHEYRNALRATFDGKVHREASVFPHGQKIIF